MPVSEYGEIGCCIEEDKEGGMLIDWRIRKVEVASSDNESYGWKKGDKIYYTSRGWVHVPDEQVFMPSARERSLRQCILRSIDYAKKKWPGLRMETH